MVEKEEDHDDEDPYFAGPRIISSSTCQLDLLQTSHM